MSQMFKNCIADAKKLGTELFPIDCIDILERNYKGRMDLMKRYTIIKKVYDLMGVITDSPDYSEIVAVVNNWMNKN